MNAQELEEMPEAQEEDNKWNDPGSTRLPRPQNAIIHRESSGFAPNLADQIKQFTHQRNADKVSTCDKGIYRQLSVCLFARTESPTLCSALA
jgi:hypothetical protein